MTPKAPEEINFDTTNSDDIKEVFNLFSQTIKDLNEKLDKFANGSLKPQAPETKQLDTMNSDDIKKSFLMFSRAIKKLDIQLDKFRAGFLRLGHVKGLSFAIEKVQDGLKQTRESFFRNAVALAPELYELAYREHLPAARRGRISEQIYIRKEYFGSDSLSSDDALPTVLEGLAASISLLHERTDEFQEFTAEGSRLKDLFSTLNSTLSYRASCTKDYSEQMDTTVIQRHIHRFIYDLEIDFKNSALAMGDFIAISIPAIRDEKARAFKSLTNILAAATLFSGVTASTLQISTAISNPNNTILVVNALWFTSLTLSVGAALNCVLYGAFAYLLDVIKPSLSSSDSNTGKHPLWITLWMNGSHSFLLGASILTFSSGLSVFTFSSNQPIYTPYLTIASMVLASAGLGAILIWILYKIMMAKWQTGAISAYNKISLFRDRIVACIENALPWLLLQKPDHPQSRDVEKNEDEAEDSPSQEPNPPDSLTSKIENGVKRDSIGRKKQHDPDETNSPAALTELILPDEAVPQEIDFGYHGTIGNVEYSNDGKWLSITHAKQESSNSCTTILNAKTLETVYELSHTQSSTSIPHAWSPSGNKLIVEFDNQCDIWDHLASDMVKPIEFEIDIQDVAWFDEDAFLVASYAEGCVIKKDLMGLQKGRYEFKNALIESIDIERETKYLILMTHVGKLDLVYSGPSEKRIVIYNMDEEETIYQIPFLQDFCCATRLPKTLDILIRQIGHKVFELWSLDIDTRDPGSTNMLKKNFTPHDNVDPEDYIELTRIGGNRDQFVLNGMKSGIIDIWRRDTGKLYRRFRSPMLQEGVQCFSWRRSDDETATLAAAGTESSTLLVWRGEERPVPETSDSPKLAMNEKIRTRFQQTVYKAVASSQSASSVPPGAKEVEEENILKVDPPNGPEAGPSTSKS